MTTSDISQHEPHEAHARVRELDARVAGGLLGLAAGDALGATLEFLPAAEVRRRHGTHRDIVGGGMFGWRPGQGTDDTDLAYAVAAAYVEGYSLHGVAAKFLAWMRGGPRDAGNTTSAALRVLARSADPRSSGQAVWHDGAAGNGALMRALATGLARPDADRRRREAAEIAAVTHADDRCLSASVAYCDLVAALLAGLTPEQAVRQVATASPLVAVVRETITTMAAHAAALPATQLAPTGYVLDTLAVAVWALLQPRSLEELLIEIVNLGDDADTTGAVAGGLLGVRDGVAAIPPRWLERLEYRAALEALVPRLTALHLEGQEAFGGR